HALPESVEAPSIECVAMALRILSRVAGVVAPVPDSGWLIGFHAGAADFFYQQATGGQNGVAQHLAIHAKARAAGEKTILWILFSKLRRYASGLPVGRRHDELPIKALHIPAAIAEIDGQPVQQFRMARPCSHHPEG